ncbi:hypothetical protein B0A55_01117 [Friedmanniomyces simplex]|uniref:FAD-binding domain-containing protein n=1 Tax=Friedmanniomyces simplex TaxID=329884 RepID=A0A4U0XV60_9PEZI|nr:hypothetical protein B0A55_01117 [Friedmanniomyces simplex]
MPFRILIVGGGIAGLTAAIALRAPGRQITILEQSRLLTEIGATISLQPNASRILEREWGMGGELKNAVGIVDHGFRIYNSDGQLVNTVPLLSKTEYGGDRVMYHRQDLHNALRLAATAADRVGPPATVRTASRVVSCDCDAGFVVLESGEQVHADLIVGADGIHSVLRDHVVHEKINTVPTGLSAYRFMVPTSTLEHDAAEFCRRIKPREPFTSMVVAHSCRLIMGPARGCDVYSVVGLVPDERMNEDPEKNQSWVSPGDLDQMLETYKDFPEWVKACFRLAKDVGLWQLRDIDPLTTWTRGRVILIGDAAHAMLPTQGQGASQTVEDAEALGAFFDDVQDTPSGALIQQKLQSVFECRYTRASLIHRYSRDAARPGTENGSKEVKMKPDEFMDFNCSYKGAKEWHRRQQARGIGTNAHSVALSAHAPSIVETFYSVTRQHTTSTPRRAHRKMTALHNEQLRLVTHKNVSCHTESLSQIGARSEDAAPGHHSGATVGGDGSTLSISQPLACEMDAAVAGLASGDPSGAQNVPNMPSWDPLMGSTTFDDYDGAQVPSFFEQIMVPGPDFIGADSTQFPPIINNLFPDQDWLGEVDIFSTDFGPIVGESMVPPHWPPSDEQSPFDSTRVDVPEASSLTRVEHARRRHAIFKQSPWLWFPESKQHAFSEHHDIRLDETNLHSAASPLEPYAETLSIPDKMSMQTRDRVFQLILRTAKSQISIPSFPSAECLELLMKIGIAKRLETDAWIHQSTFCSEQARSELLTALVAAGCVCFGVKSVSRTGLVLLEIVRRALHNAVEDDNSAIRQLQYLQASMIWLDVCAFCGFKRKMEIAEGNLQPLITALRRFGKFDRVAYGFTKPSTADSDEVLEKKWHDWVELQSYSRLVYHILEHDTLMTMTKHRNPLLSYAELSLPLPASRDMWLAPSANAWRIAYLSKPDDPHQHRLSLRSLLADGSMIHCLPPGVDSRAAINAHLYGIAAQLWEYHQQALLHRSTTSAVDASASLWLQSRHQSLHQDLQALSTTIPDTSPLARLLHEFLLVSLHVSIDGVVRFAGSCGEEEAHVAYQSMQPWSQTKRARIAVWHAAQVVRWARAVRPYQLRGCDAFITYHAVMVLWAFGMMQRDATRRTARSSPAPGAAQQAECNTQVEKPLVFLDSPKCPKAESFIHMDYGRPCLQLRASSRSTPTICDLRNPQSMMNVGIDALEGNCPNEQRQGMPQMVRSLCDLMSELGCLR